MTNKEIGSKFQELAQLMEFHGENPFKIRTYQNVYATLRKLNEEVGTLTEEQLQSIKGIGSAVAGKIRELEDHGEMRTLRKYQDMTPAGVQEMLTIRGLGPKKIRMLYDQLQIESVGELRYAILENRLLELPGFGVKTQEDILQKIQYFQEAKGQFRLATLDVVAERLLTRIKAIVPEWEGQPTGDFRRRMQVLSEIAFLVPTVQLKQIETWASELFTSYQQSNGELAGIFDEIYPVRFYGADDANWGSELAKTTGGHMWESFEMPAQPFQSEADVFNALQLPYIIPECRDLRIPDYSTFDPDALIRASDIKGMIHVHTTYSDGINSLDEMAAAAKSSGYEYLVITDHSKSAVYANGLTVDRLRNQWDAIDAWNRNHAFTILKGIECDILTDGSMDYDSDVLREFEVVIASIHAQLKMDEEKATNRLIRAIEHPNVHILGHLTGRLLLSRAGYPVNHQKVIDACASNQVSIELNANPFRLDIDWTWIPYACDKGVRIAINPDAHSVRGYEDITYGITAARKAGLKRSECLNVLGKQDFIDYIRSK